MADRGNNDFIMPEGLTPDQQNAVRAAIATARAEGEARGRTAQLEADGEILDQAKELRRDAVRIRYAFMLRHRCKTEYKRLSPYYSF